MLPSLLATLLLPMAPEEVSLRAAWEGWPERRFLHTAAPCLRSAELGEQLRALVERHPGRLRLEEVGRSAEGRPLLLLTAGGGPRRVLLWSQMHGDEPSATPALLDLVDTLLTADPDRVLERLTLLVLPMLNPDGAERHQRRNAQGIDLNRDALALATPEGRVLKALRDRFGPELGFNLHDQDRRTTLGDGGAPATVSLLAVAGDPQGTLTPGRARARRVCGRLARTLPELVPGGVARYDEDWNPRAFGDNLTAWGTPVVLIESGGLPPGRPPSDLTRLHYVALLEVLQGLARDDLASEDPAVYDRLARNRGGMRVDVLLAGGQMAQPTAAEPFRADLGFDLLDDERRLAACPGAAAAPSRISEVGDARLLSAARRIDATGRLLVPALAASLRGPAARAWLDAASLEALARLGVARLLWHVGSGSRQEAETTAARLSAPGRPAIEVVGEDRARSLLRLRRRPRLPAGRSLGDALDALTGGTWRAGARGRNLPALLTDLAGLPEGGGPTAPILEPGQRASLLVLRPREPGALDPGSLEIEAVFVDGREPAPAR